jgi:hypothetical protein
MKARVLLIIFAISLVNAILLLKYCFSTATDFSTFALGTETATYWATDSNRNIIHVSTIDSAGNQTLINSWRKAGKKNVLLVLGNSQSHSINQKKEGEVTYIELLHKNVKNYSVFANTFPNASMQDFLISYTYWKSILPIKAVVVPVFLDDMREINGIGYNFYPELGAQNFRFQENGSPLLRKLNRSFLSLRENELFEDSTGNHQHLSTQDKTEKLLNTMLENTWEVWNNRKNAQGLLFGRLYILRNTIFNIKATTVRRMMPDRYADNMAALDLIVSDARKNGIKVLVYVPPIRDDVDKPYDPKEYNTLKVQLQNISNRYLDVVHFKDYDNIVPGKYFGYKATTSLSNEKEELDFMHFQYTGHRILFDSLSAHLLNNGIR